MSDRARLYRALLRQDLSAFAQKAFLTLEPGTTYRHNWHIDHLCWRLSQVARGELRRLVINVPPRSMKSITVSVAFTAWMMGRDPTKRLICVSYADDLARKLSIDCRTLIESAWYRQLFPNLELASRRPRASELTTIGQGYRFAAGLGGAILGRGADLIVVDDPIKATDALSAAERRRVNEAFDATLQTRLNDKTRGAIVIIMQRLHEDDLVGHVLGRDGEAWEVVPIPAIATEDATYRLGDGPDEVYHRRAGEVLHAAREPLEILEGVRRAQGSLLFSAQYQQAPVPPEGNVVRREWLRYYKTPPSAFDYTVASWDTASTLSEGADWSVGTVWGAKGLDFYLLDRVRGRFTFLQTIRGEARSPNGLGNAMRRWCDAAGLPECTSHGLRKACARRLAEARCSPHMIMAVTGHVTLKEVERYTRAANRSDMADDAFAMLAERMNWEQVVTNHPARFVKSSRKPLKRTE